jgi:transposase-like protein
MKQKPNRVYSREFKRAAVERMQAGENVSARARQLRLRRKQLYEWKEAFRSGGEAALRPPGRPRRETTLVSRLAAPSAADSLTQELAAARQRIAELERKIGQQEVAQDFFVSALRAIAAIRPLSGAPRAMPSTESSRR